jgi:hypothetical protein
MELEIIVLSKISQTQKDKYCMFFIMHKIQIKNNESRRGELFGEGGPEGGGGEK